MSSQAKPIYVIYGQDGYLRLQHRQAVLAELLGPEPDELSVSWLDASAERAEVFDELRTASLLTGRRVVVIGDADAFVSANREALEDYLDHPSTSGSLVLMVDRWDARWNLAKRVAQLGGARDCSPPPESALPGWIVRAARQRGKKIATEVAKELAAYVLADLARLDGEVEKLSLYVGDRAEITAEDVLAVVAHTSGPAKYALTDAIDAGRSADALEALGDMMTARGEEFRILGLLAWQLRSRRDGTGPRGGRPRRPDPPNKARRQFRSLMEADLALKSGADPLTTMQLLVMELCR